MTSTDAIAAKNAFVLITNKFVIKTNSAIRAVIQSNYFSVSTSTTVRGWTTSLSLLIFKLTAWIAANVYAYVHGHTRTHNHSPMRDKFENFINFIFNNQCTIDC